MHIVTEVWENSRNSEPALKFHVPSLHSPYKKIVFDFCNPFWRCLKCTNIGFFTLKLSLVCLKQQKKNNIYSPFTGKTCVYLCFLFCCKGHSMKKCLELNFLNFICNFLLCCLQQWLVNNTLNFAFLKLFLLNRNRHLLKFSLQPSGNRHHFRIEIIKFSKGKKIFKI